MQLPFDVEDKLVSDLRSFAEQAKQLMQSQKNLLKM
jgi:hypothetical protein